MKNILRKTYVVLFTFSAFLLSGCSEMFDCVASARPNLHSKTLLSGNAGNPYSDYIDADVTNDTHDNDYDYYFTVIGNLPPGMTYREQRRSVYFTGTPTQAGTYTFKIRLTVDPPDYYDEDGGLFDDSNHICFGDDTTTKEYTIVIN